MIKCWWLVRYIVRGRRHVVPDIGRGIRHHKAAVVATIVCTVTATPLGYGVGQGAGWWGGDEYYGGQSLGAATDERLTAYRLALGNVSVAPSPEPTSVPEPSSLALFAAALVPLIIIRRVL